MPAWNAHLDGVVTSRAALAPREPTPFRMYGVAPARKLSTAVNSTGVLVADAAEHTDWLDLADALTALREQLAEARMRASGSPVRLSVEEVTVEFGLELQRSAKGDGAFRFGVVGAGGGGERARRTTHTVTLRLAARTDEDGPVDVSDVDDDV